MSKHKRLNRDQAKKTQRPMVEEEVIANQLEALLTPAITAQENYYRQLKLRDRILNLPLMVAAVLTLLWRDVAGVTELTRILAREGFLWCNQTQVSQQAISSRFLTFPAELFERVFKDLLPQLKSSWLRRQHRPLPESIQFTLSKFENIWIVDGSTLEALFKKLKSLEEIPRGQLAGKMGVVIDLVTRLPVEIWFQENPRASDTKLEENILNLGSAKTLLLLDRGFYHFSFWLQLIVDRISLEMIYRGLYHFAVARQKGLTNEPIKYFAAPENRDLGIVKSIRKPQIRLIIAPFPERQKNSPNFFFSSGSQTQLTTATQA